MNCVSLICFYEREATWASQATGPEEQMASCVVSSSWLPPALSPTPPPPLAKAAIPIFPLWTAKVPVESKLACFFFKKIHFESFRTRQQFNKLRQMTDQFCGRLLRLLISRLLPRTSTPRDHKLTGFQNDQILPCFYFSFSLFPPPYPFFLRCCIWNTAIFIFHWIWWYLSFTNLELKSSELILENRHIFTMHWFLRLIRSFNVSCWIRVIMP